MNNKLKLFVWDNIDYVYTHATTICAVAKNEEQAVAIAIQNAYNPHSEELRYVLERRNPDVILDVPCALYVRGGSYS